ncbi:protein phosphatase 2C [Trypanosoma theileri]|uniref:Protein phosphatase 2C n=1 Tax=Trypanosoma theileri TaxID=67003 RepID=A0A1X0P810_9TRYP|nr:protein phosphatase 2C [Trypanosoma theileri]ORC93086.1 protein phosphatase 2C [Trypanosoma theileri]
MIQLFPLQNKKMLRLSLPFMSVGVCEVMNCVEKDLMSSFLVHNTRNRGAYSELSGTSNYSNCNKNKSNSESSPTTTTSSTSTNSLVVPFMGEVVAGGLCDSFTGHYCPRFISQYLARALSIHSVLPSHIAQLRREVKDDAIIALMMSALSRERALHDVKGLGETQPIRRLFSEWVMHQYAMFADSAFFDVCRKGILHTGEVMRNDNLLESEAANSGSRAVWFTASVAPFELQQWRQKNKDEVHHRSYAPPPPPQPPQPPQRFLEMRKDSSDNTVGNISDSFPSFAIDVLLSNVGDSRAFGIARHSLSEGIRSSLDPSRERIVPLSTDHKPLRTQEFRRILRAGGVVRSDVGDIIDGNPFYNVSRSFGHWSMKCDMKRSPSEQKLIALPSCSSWEMLPGDVLVLCNHGMFETRSQQDTSMDELAKVVGRELRRGSSPEQIAAALCDHAIRFGAQHSLQAMVAVATDTNASSSEVEREEWVEPGPFYVEPFRQSSAYRNALCVDCDRCGVTLAELLELRWQRVREFLPTRYALPLMPYYGKECSTLQQIMDEEALLFNHESLPPLGESIEKMTSEEKRRVKETFVRMSRSLLSSTPPLSI